MSSQQNPRSDEGLAQILWRQRKLVMASLFCCLVCGVAYSIIASPAFIARSRLYVEQNGPKIISDSSISLRDSFRGNYLYTQGELLKSLPVLSSALQTPGFRGMRTFRGVQDPLLHLQKSLEVQIGKRDDIIAISLQSAQADEAAKIVNAVVDSYIAYQAGQKRSTSTEVLKILQRERGKCGEDLKQQTEATLAFRRANPSLSYENDKGNVIIHRLGQLSEALTAAQVERINATTAYESAAQLLRDPSQIRPFIQAQFNGTSAAFDKRYADLRTELDGMEIRAAALRFQLDVNHPTVQNALKYIQETKARIAAEEKQFAAEYLAHAQQRQQSATLREAELQKAFDEQQKLGLELNSKSAELAALTSELKRTEKICDILDARMKEVNVTGDGGALNISVIERAHPQRPDYSQEARAAAVALVAGLVLGTVLALVRQRTDKRFRSSIQIASTLDVPVLASLPQTASSTTLSQELISNSDSELSEAVRSLRTSLPLSQRSGKATKLLISSANSGEGKSIVAANFAVAAAQAGRRVLLIDANLRSPTLHKTFNVLRDDVGICGLLAGKETLAKVIARTEVEGLDVLVAGTTPSNPSAILNSRGFAHILTKMCENYDLVVLDSPRAMNSADARILAALSDMTLLVLRADLTSSIEAQQVVAALNSTGTPVAGVVVNAVTRSQSTAFGPCGACTSSTAWTSRGEPSVVADAVIA